jgi:hypothetical protein
MQILFSVHGHRGVSRDSVVALKKAYISSVLLDEIPRRLSR